MVRNAAHSDNFALDSAEVRARLKRELGGRELTMPRMQDSLVEALNRENVTVTVATKHPAFSLLDRQRFLTWQRRLYGEIDPSPKSCCRRFSAGKRNVNYSETEEHKIKPHKLRNLETTSLCSSIVSEASDV